MAYFLKSGTRYRVSSKEEMDLHESLPAGNYVVKIDPFENFYLEAIDNFDISGKLYGDTLKNTDRILSTFHARSASTGVMLNGEKGSGKTLLAKNIAFEAAKQGIPTLIINTPFCGDKFNAFMQSIDQPLVILFDEFEKVYGEDQQEAMLTLLDGVFPSKKLFLITCNDKWRVNAHMRNRPGRIFYMLEFKGLSGEFIREYCEDNLNDKSHIDRLVQIAGTFDQFNFDMLKATIEEMNRYNEPPHEAMRILNAKPEFGAGASRFTVKLQMKGQKEVEAEGEEHDTTEWRGNPLNGQVRVNYKTVDEEGCEDWDEIRFNPNDLKKIEGDGTRYIFTNDRGDKVTLVKVQEKEYNYWGAF